MQCLSFFYQVYSDGEILKSLIWLIMLAVVRKDVFSKLILNTLKSYKNYTMIVHYEIKTEDVYEDFSNDKEMFDFSNYSTKWKYYDNSNKLVVGKIKD